VSRGRGPGLTRVVRVTSDQAPAPADRPPAPTNSDTTDPRSPGLPARARVVVIGGGIIGTSIAYHLAELGWTDTVLLERDRLTSGTTWHAAGLMVTFGSTSQTSTELRMYTKDLYSRLEAETGQATGFRPIGLIEVAADEGRLEEYRRVSAFNRHCGVDVHEISAREVGELFPIARTDDILAAFFTPTDGRVNPVDVTMALAKGARRRGATLLEGTPAIDVLTRDGAVVGVRTPTGDIECEYVVNAAGMWARQLGERSGVSIPLQAAEHYYLITGAMPEVDPDWPVLEDPSNFTYIRPEGDGLMVGLFETICAPWNVGRIPEDFSFGTIAPDWDRMGPYVEAAMSRVPATLDAGIHTFFCGPESFTPDLLPVIGEAPEVRNYFVAAGLNSIGILTGGGWGRAIAHWITTGSPDIDITGVNIDRLHPYQATPRYRATRTVESLGMVYECHYPGRSMRTARGVRRSPLHERMAAQGAWFKDVSGWEGTDWFAGAGVVADEPALTWGRPGFWEHWAAEHRAVREGVGLFDMSFMAKFEVTGPDAGALLDRLSANAVDGEPGRITYTQWLNEQGRIEADVTVTKRADGDFLVVASDTAHRHVLTWLRRHVSDARVSIADVTSGLAQITVQGPRAREVLAAVTSVDLSDAAFPFRAAREIDLGFALGWCTRITYVGELGYELFVPAEMAVAAYDEIAAAGAAFGLRHCGLKALGSLRLEKAYRDYGHDIDNTDDPLEAGLGFAVSWDKPGGFLGRDALAARRAAGSPTRRLVQVLLTDPEPFIVHAELLRRNGVEVGYLRSASYGFTLGGAVGLAMVDSAPVEVGRAIDAGFLASGEWAVQVGNRVVPAQVSLAPLYDPRSERVRG
jgi:glycine cleavage system aminomethyltransferase T/glycine/D-amino acid oxidase-like deaminating enzyme